MKDYFSLDLVELCLLHNQAHRVLRNTTARALKQFELTVSDWLVLSALHRQGRQKVTPTKLSLILHISLPQLSYSLDRLKNKNLVVDYPAASDKRLKTLKCSKKGRILVKKVENSLRQYMKEQLGDIPRDQLVSYMKTVDFLSGNSLRL